MIGKETKIRREVTGVIGICKELFPGEYTGQSCFLEDSVRMVEQIGPLIIPLLVMLTGTRQKIVTVDKILHDTQTGLQVRNIVSYDSIEVDESGYRHGGEIAKDKLIGFFKLFWEKYGGFGRSESCFGQGKCYTPMIFLASDVKVSLGALGAVMQPHHKLRKEIPSKITSLASYLPKFFAETYQKELGGNHLVVRWSTGNAALRVLNRDGDYALAYGQSEASISLPNWLVTDVRFWEEYVRYGMKKRDGSLRAHLGSPMGLLIEDVYEMVRDPEIMKRIGRDCLSDHDLSLMIPGCPTGMTQVEYLVNHAKGAANNVVEAVLMRITQMIQPGEVLIGEREMMEIPYWDE